MVTAYALAFGSLLLLGGRLGDLIGRKVTFLGGLIGFAAASAVGGAATSFTMLVTARACQGAFGAFLAPAALSLLTTTFSDPKDRGKAFGVYGAIAGGGGAVGLLLGGVLTEYLSWRWCLYVNLFFAAIAAIGGDVAAAPPPAERATGRGWTSRRGARLARHVLHRLRLLQRRHPRLARAVHLGLPGRRRRAAGRVRLVGGPRVPPAAAAAGRAGPQPRRRLPVDPDRAARGMFGIFLFLTYYMQQTLRFSPVITGLAFLPMVAMIMVAPNLSNIVLLPRLGPKPLVTLGMLLAAGGMVWLTRIGPHSGYAAACSAPLLIVGVGFGLMIAPAINTGTYGVAPQDAGVASASVNTGQQIGGSIGTSLLNTMAASATAAT